MLLASIHAQQASPNGRSGNGSMPEILELNPDGPCPSTIYKIRLRGHLGPEWAEWFDGLTITLEDNGDTLLAGSVADQAALHGLLKRVRDLGMPLVSVVCKEWTS
jgi:hypothetical protein